MPIEYFVAVQFQCLFKTTTPHTFMIPHYIMFATWLGWAMSCCVSQHYYVHRANSRFIVTSFSQSFRWLHSFIETGSTLITSTVFFFFFVYQNLFVFLTKICFAKDNQILIFVYCHWQWALVKVRRRTTSIQSKCYKALAPLFLHYSMYVYEWPTIFFIIITFLEFSRNRGKLFPFYMIVWFAFLLGNFESSSN